MLCQRGWTDLSATRTPTCRYVHVAGLALPAISRTLSLPAAAVRVTDQHEDQTRRNDADRHPSQDPRHGVITQLHRVERTSGPAHSGWRYTP
jgi:hypothetical protein